MEKQSQDSVSSSPIIPDRIFQNNYTLCSKRPFDEIKVQTQIKNVMEMNLREVEYSEQSISDLCILLVGEIITAIKSNDFDRYRLIVNVAIGQKKMQGLNMAHSFLWDHEKDRYVEYTYDMPSFFVQAVVYGVYFD